MRKPFAISGRTKTTVIGVIVAFAGYSAVFLTSFESVRVVVASLGAVGVACVFSIPSRLSSN